MPIDMEQMDAAIEAILSETYGMGRNNLTPIVLAHHEAIYRAGYLAGLRAAAEIAFATPDQVGTLADDSHKECAVVAKRLIRATADALEAEK